MRLKLNRRTTAFVLAISILAFPAVASAASVSWMGVTWDDPFGQIAVNGANLEVTSSGCDDPSCWGAAHYNTPNGFRLAANTSVTATWIDEGSGTPGGQIWIEEESASGGWIQLGASQSRANYYLVWWEYMPDDSEVIETDVPRTAGEHTFTVGKRADGTVDYYIDGDLVFSSAPGLLSYIGDVYLAAHSSAPGAGTVVSTNYSTSTDYPGPIGPPTTKDECKSGGWQAFNNPKFKNQGDCIQYVNTGK